MKGGGLGRVERVKGGRARIQVVCFYENVNAKCFCRTAPNEKHPTLWRTSISSLRVVYLIKYIHDGRRPMAAMSWHRCWKWMILWKLKLPKPVRTWL